MDNPAKRVARHYSMEYNGTPDSNRYHGLRKPRTGNRRSDGNPVCLYPGIQFSCRCLPYGVLPGKEKYASAPAMSNAAATTARIRRYASGFCLTLLVRALYFDPIAGLPLALMPERCFGSLSIVGSFSIVTSRSPSCYQSLSIFTDTIHGLYAFWLA